MIKLGILSEANKTDNISTITVLYLGVSKIAV